MSLLSHHTSGARLYDTHNVFGTFAAKARRPGSSGARGLQATALLVASVLLPCMHAMQLYVV